MHSFEQRVEKFMEDQSARILKIETNHLAHMEADMRFLKEFAVRMERTISDMSTELKGNSKDTHELKLDFATKLGEVNTKIATIDTREGSNSGWLKDLMKIVLGLLVGAAGMYFGSK